MTRTKYDYKKQEISTMLLFSGHPSRGAFMFVALYSISFSRGVSLVRISRN